MPHSIETIAAVFFAIAVAHTFAVKKFQSIAKKFPEGSIGENLFHLLGEVEVVFGLWAGALVIAIAVLENSREAIRYVDSLDFTEPAFVFVIMAMAATKPIVSIASAGISLVARVLPFSRSVSYYFTTLFLGPLLGSFITEPAAMTVTALILKDSFFGRSTSERFKYVTLSVLFVNISIGGVLTPFAAPPVLMVATKWGWGMDFMLAHFGWKAVIATLLNTTLGVVLLRKELAAMKWHSKSTAKDRRIPLWLTLTHLAFTAMVVLTSHHPVFFLGLFLFFQGIVAITQEHQEELKLKESLLVGFFLAGLVVLGDLQGWWLKPLLLSLSDLPLFVGATALTAIVDNAALTYLGTQVPNLSETLRFALVSGAVAGGGLTIIANAPNPAGFAILRDTFGTEGISPTRLFLNSLAPTLIAMLCLWLLPNLAL